MASAAVQFVAPRRAFAAPTQARRAVISMAAYTVTFIDKNGTEKKIQCDADDYLLDAADAAGVDLAASCRGGGMFSLLFLLYFFFLVDLSFR